MFNFGMNQITSKLAQRWRFVCNFYCQKICTLASFDNAENTKKHFFLLSTLYQLWDGQGGLPNSKSYCPMASPIPYSNT